ncbi:baseplate assembly protein [Paenibacillus hubeiensis]|uniref:baseplate assembly protein n=1 Tax=Paenibacillus hubeiensis TaxID=3077330 RepID=UPI0031BBCB3C
MVELVELPEIVFNEQDVPPILNNIIALYEGLSGRNVNRADPEMFFFNSLAHIILLQNVAIDASAKSVLLRYASGWVLDYIGDFTKTTRLEAAYATTTLEFTLSSTFVVPVTIPAGSRVSPEDAQGELYFATTQDIVIPAGQTSGAVSARSLTAGIVGNDFAVGTINTIIDPLPFVQTVSNITVTAGGADREDDESYRARIRGAGDSYSTAGPEGAYIYWAKTASSAIADVAAFSPAVREVTVVPLLENGVMPTPEILAAVKSVLNDRKVRPLTDVVTVQAPTVVDYKIEFTYYIDEADASDEAVIKKSVDDAVSAYVLWQRSALGRAINPAELVKRVMAAGVLRIDMANMLPAFQALEQSEFAVADSITVTYGGLESW